MKILKKVTEARHFLAISALALMMSVFASAAGKAAVQSSHKMCGDPVISSMTWEQSTSDYTDYGPGDIPALACNGNCPKNCNPNCVINCNINCVSNC